MGHYWSEMRPHEPERHPTPLEAMGFHKLSSHGSYNQYYHQPCLQIFLIHHTHKVPDAIYYHANHCPMIKGVEDA